jgi:integrase/recombinase XerD
MLISEAITQYLDFLRASSLAELTIYSYGRDLGLFEYHLRKIKDITDTAQLTKKDTEEYLYHLKQTQKETTTNRRLSSVKNLFEYLLDHKIIPENYAKGIRQAKIVRAKPRYLTVEQYKSLLDAASQHPQGLMYKTIIKILANTGLRISELLNLTSDDVQGKDIFYIVGKGKKERPVEISGSLKEDIQNYIIARKKIAVKVPYLFISTWKRKLSADRVQSAFRILAAKAGLTIKVTPHILRHSFATWLNDEGIDIKTIQELLGHSSITTTQIYTHIDRNKKLDAVRKVSEKLSD